ncbi:hypothetical protein ACIBF5_09950 [Micromonospora sp. NPDC050417]|uniref:hypothetical protein n=1 Tax=Micromonospora sp. NPDC050417 TaxID=3364280 RepID=UPI0037B59FC9
MSTVTTGTGQSQKHSPVSAEKALVGGLLLVTCTAIGAMLWIVLVSGQHIGAVAQVAITAISGVALAAIGALTVALQKRRTRTTRS